MEMANVFVSFLAIRCSCSVVLVHLVGFILFFGPHYLSRGGILCQHSLSAHPQQHGRHYDIREMACNGAQPTPPDWIVRWHEERLKNLSWTVLYYPYSYC